MAKLKLPSRRNEGDFDCGQALDTGFKILHQKRGTKTTLGLGSRCSRAEIQGKVKDIYLMLQLKYLSPLSDPGAASGQALDKIISLLLPTFFLVIPSKQ